MGNVKVGNFPIQTGPDFLSEMGRNRGLGRFHDHVGVVGGQVGVPSDGLWWSEEVLGGRPKYPGTVRRVSPGATHRPGGSTRLPGGDSGGIQIL